jgi:PAS domain S-box-containing protein
MSPFNQESAEARRLFYSIAETAADGILVIDTDSIIQFANPAIESIFGYSSDELIGQALMKLMSPQLADLHRGSFKRYLETGVRRLNWKAIELPGLRKDGSIVPIEVSFSEVQQPQHLFTGFVRDITARKETERRLRAAENAARASQGQLRLITDAVPALISYIDQDERYRFVNETYRRWFGVPKEQIIGRHIADVLGGAVYKQIQPYIARALQGEAASADVKVHYPLVGWRSVRFEYIPEWEDEHVRGFVALITDVTENKQAIQEREELLAREQTARLQSESANRLKDEFLATVSHELRTPLTSIAGWSAMMESGRLDEPTREKALAVIRRNVHDQTRLIDELLDVSTMVAGKMQLDLHSVFPGPLVENILESFRPMAESRAIALEKIIDVHAGPVSGDAMRLKQIAANLISNAVKFTPRGGRVRITVERVDSVVALRVSDTGIGLEASSIPRIFERFWQADSSPTRRFPGLGLGLSLVRHLVELHGGSIDAFSPGPNRGSTFTVTIPVQG